MKKKIVAILDREERYARRLTEVFNSKNRLGFQAEMFTGIDTFLEYSRKNTVELLLIGDSLMQKSLESCADMIIVISEGTKVAQLDEYPIVYKYQSAELIIRKVLECYAKDGKKPEQLCKDTMTICGVYAPVGRKQKTEYAWELAKEAGREKSVLFISLTAFLARKELYEKEKDLADLMYYVHQGFDNLIYLVSSMVASVEGIDCMPPMQVVDDLQQVTCADWLKLLQVICSQSNYEVVIIDVDECVQQFYRILDYCSEVYIPYGEGRKDEFVWERCADFFKRMGVDEVWKRAKHIKMANPIRI